MSGYAGSDRLLGRGGDDTLIGGTGDDTLSGGSGSDVYMFGLGDGHDSIFDPEANDSPRSDDINVLRFGEGIASSDVRGTGNGSDLILTVQSTGESVTLWSWRNPAYDHVSRVEFHDGTIWEEATLSAAAMNVVGTDGDDDLQGRALADILTGMAGNDDLIGWGGDDTLIGGTGDDTLSGGSGSDVYKFGLGDGHDVVSNNVFGDPHQPGDIDIVRFGEGIAASDVHGAMSGLDLVLTVLSTGESVTLSQWNNSPTTMKPMSSSTMDRCWTWRRWRSMSTVPKETISWRVRIKPTSCPVTPVVTDCLVGAVTTHLSAVRATTH
ncbi:MAG: hypothetical protein IPL72_13880 [Sulfuritalea sp.]|nr:hypothetical protein [Sulfuritalea sp.]